MFGRGEGRDGEGAVIMGSSRYTQAKKKKEKKKESIFKRK